MENSKFLSLGKNDLLKGLIVSIITAVLTAIYTALESGAAVDYQMVIKLAITSGIAYILKNILSNSEGKPFVPEVKSEEKTTE